MKRIQDHLIVGVHINDPDQVQAEAEELLSAIATDLVVISTTNCPLCGEDCIDNHWNCDCLTGKQQDRWYQRHNS
ncbi:MAG: hypothetical protein KQI81_08765 [Deltaproteobacteria bacterium]|nr:hypothetical protein [Deltaproteobacteria bacterium]